MKQFILIITCVAVILSNLHGQYSPAALDSVILQKIDAYHLPGVQACIVKENQLIWKNNYGYANLEQNRLVSDSTLFYLASISKTVVATAIMQLWEQGLFNLDDDVNDYLPFPVRNPKYPDTPITFRMLLTHLSSIHDHNLYQWFVWGKDSPITLDSFLVNYLLPDGSYYSSLNYNSWNPGSQFEYSNVGAVLLGHLVEKISTKSLEQYCQESIFVPLGMNEISWFQANLDTSHIAMPYNPSRQPYGHRGSPTYPAGQLRTSAMQLSRYLRAYMQMGQLNGYRLLDSATVDLMTTIHHDPGPDYGPDVGLIWHLTELDIPYIGKRKIWYHTGGSHGATTVLGYIKGTSENVGAIIFTNLQVANIPRELGPDMFAYGLLYKKIYAKKISLNSHFIHMDRDTISINAEFENPENNNFVSNAIIMSDNSSYRDTVTLYDDGNHGDQQADDGVWGNFLGPFAWEDVFTVDISTKDLESGEYLYQNSRAHFTTIGPVVFDHFEIISTDTIPNPGDQIRIRMFLRNDGSVETASNITAKLTSLDTGVTVGTFPPLGSYVEYGDIGVDDISESARYYLISFNGPFDKYYYEVPFEIDIRSGDYSFWIDTTFSILVGIEQQKGKPIPKDFALYQNYPNPFNPVTMINYQLPVTSAVELSIYNLLGQKVATLVNKRQTAGSYQAQWDASAYASGVYLYRLRAGDFVETKKLILLK